MPHFRRPTSSIVPRLINFLGRLSPLDCFREKRFWRYAMLPLLGSIVPVLVLAIHKGNPIVENLVGLVSAVARVLPFVLLVRVLDQDSAGPFQLRVSWLALAVCFVGFSGPILIGVRPSVWHGSMQSAIYPLLLIALLAGIFSAIPPGEIIRRAARHRISAAMAFVGLLPYVYRLILATEWRMLYPISITLLRWLLNLNGIETTATEYWHQRFGFAVLIRARHWELIISKECSGTARIVIFVTLFVSMLLLNPARLRQRLAVALSFLIGLIAVLGIEPVRWASLVSFAEHTVRDEGRTAIAYRLIEAYHHTGAQYTACSSLAILAIYFYLVSRWLDLRAKTTQNHFL